MRARVFTALILGGLLIAALQFGNGFVVGGVLALFVLAGAWEWAVFCGLRSLAGRAAYLLLVIGVVLALRLWWWEPAAFRLLMSGLTCWWLLALCWLWLAPHRVSRLSAAIAGLLTLAPTWVVLVRIAGEWPQGPQWAMFIICLAVAMDTGGFFAGRAFGRLKLAPHISPGKTWEGVFGGMALALLWGFLGQLWFGVSASVFLPLCLAAAAAGVVGDLLESKLKRATGLKDSGRLFPGHGGVLDRIDSVMAVAPVMALGLIWMGAGS